jgi:hypothetical protein
MKNIILGRLLAFILVVGLTSCLADLRTIEVKKSGVEEENINRGKALLEEAWLAQGMDKLMNHQVYQIEAHDTWKGALGKMGTVWRQPEADLRLRYKVNTFTGGVEILSGKSEGLMFGLQSWNYWEKPQGEELKFYDKGDKRYVFGQTAYHYFFELIDRLKSAELITYAGEKEFNGNTYDLVFASWHELGPHKSHDQYVAWINRETHLLEFTEYTIRDNYLKMPGSAMLHGSIQFNDLREVNGVLFPFEQIVYFQSPKSNEERFLHKLEVTSICFDCFDESLIQPGRSLQIYGDDKPAKP